MNGKHIPQYLNIMSLFEVVPSVAKGFRLWQNDLKKKIIVGNSVQSTFRSYYWLEISFYV